MSIRTDMGVNLYVEVKKREIGFGMYPLCIDTIDKDVSDIESFDVSTGLIVCVEGHELDILALNLVESKNGNSCYILELEVMNYICDTKSTDVKVDQLYKDKATLVSVMAKYKIKHGFNFRVKRSDNKRYGTWSTFFHVLMYQYMIVLINVSLYFVETVRIHYWLKL